MALKTAVLTGASLAWIAGVVWGFSLLLRYEATAGQAGDLPATLTDVGQSDGPKTLAMFVHPRCPCTRASLAELEYIMVHCEGRIRADVFVVQPEFYPATWSQGELWNSAAALPGVTVHTDVAGRKAKEFGARTSGHVVVLDGSGRLLFSGGITGSRGHQGDNPGRQAVLDLIRGLPVANQESPVFGCTLIDSPQTCSKDPSSCRN